MIKYTEESDAKEFIVGTEIGILYELQKKCPDKSFYFPENTPVCPDMKLITLEKILKVLETEENSVSVDEELTMAASRTLERMLELAK